MSNDLVQRLRGIYPGGNKCEPTLIELEAANHIKMLEQDNLLLLQESSNQLYRINVLETALRDIRDRVETLDMAAIIADRTLKNKP